MKFIVSFLILIAYLFVVTALDIFLILLCGRSKRDEQKQNFGRPKEDYQARAEEDDAQGTQKAFQENEVAKN